VKVHKAASELDKAKAEDTGPDPLHPGAKEAPG